MSAAALVRPRGAGGNEEGGEDPKRYWLATGKKGPVAGGRFVPREPYNLLKDLKRVDFDTAFFWGLGHSWLCNFGLTGAEAENQGETPRVRCMLTESVPPIVLMELASLSTFNMLDPVLGADIQGMQQAVNECLMTRSRDAGGYPLGYVLQGVGPHFCPGGNHHPVTPPGGTPFTTSSHITSLWNVQFREHAMPGITAITGSAVGGGVAVSVNTTQRVAASNASMAFGNLSRGASPLMWLSKNLVNELGMSDAVSIYLTDGTVSAYGGLKAGLVMGVSPSIAAVKNRAMLISKAIASSPASRLVCRQLTDLNTHRFAQEAMMFTFNAKSGTMFGNLAGKKKKSSAETVAIGDERRDAEDGRKRVTSGSSGSAPPRRKSSSRPRPFPERIGTRPIAVACCDTPCAQCGSQGADGTIYGDTYYCDTCWRTLGPSVADAIPEESPHAGGPPQREKVKCSSCSSLSSSGRHGAGAYASEFYCSRCWRRWRGGGAPQAGPGFATDVSTTDHDPDSGTDCTIVSDCVSAASGSDGEWWW